MRKFICIIIFILICLSGFPQINYLRFRHLTEKEGLPYERIINSFAQDKSGFLWFASEAGLHRFDGNQFKSYYHDQQNKNSIAGNFVNKIFIDRQNRFWVATNNGFDLFLQDKEIFVHISVNEGNKPYYSSNFKSIVQSPNGEIYVYTYSAVFLLNIENMCLEQCKFSGYILSLGVNINSLFIDGYGNYYFGTVYHGLLVFDKNQLFKNQLNTESSAPFQVNSNNITSITEDAEKNIWFGTEYGIYKMNLQNLKLKHYDSNLLSSKSLTHQNSTNLFNDNNNRLWIGTEGGLNLYDKENDGFIHFVHNDSDPFSICGNKVKQLFVDKQNNLWLSSLGAGISYANLKSSDLFTNFTNIVGQKNSLSYNLVDAFCEDNEGNLWIGTDGGGLEYFNRKTQTFTHYDNNNPKSKFFGKISITALFFDSNKELWIGTYLDGLIRWNPQTGNYKIYKAKKNDNQSLPSNFVTAIVETSDNKILALTLGGGLAIYNAEKQNFTIYKKEQDNSNSLCHDSGACLYIDSNLNIWIGTYFGATCWNRKTNKFINFYHDENDKNSLRNNSVFSFCEDNKGRIWIGTDEGVNLYNPENKTISYVESLKVLDLKSIFGILQDNDGNIWFATNKELVRYNSETKNTTFFDYSDGLPGDLNKNSFYKCRNGEMFIGGTKGFTVFSPEKILQNKKQPEVIINDLKITDQSVLPEEKVNDRIVLQKSISQTNSIVLTHKENVFSFEFGAIEYFAPEAVQYMYMLDGFDKTWRTTDFRKRTATYTNLNAGTYKFKVKACFSNNSSNTIVKEIQIKILPPWWHSWWAFVLYFGIFWGFLYLYISILKSKMLLKKNLLLEKIQHDKDAEINNLKINFFTNITHEFRTPLTLIIGPVEKLLEKLKDNAQVYNQLFTIKKNSERLLNLINELLDFRKIESGKEELLVTKTQLIEFVKFIADSYSEHARIHSIEYIYFFSKKEIEVYIDKTKYEKVIFNILSNAFKFTPDNGKVQVFINSENEGKYVEIKILDSGIGILPDKIDKIFDKFYSSNTTTSSFSSGIGLALSKEIVELHHGKISMSSESGKGSSCSILILLGNEHFTQKQLIAKKANTVNSFLDFSDIEEIAPQDNENKAVKVPETAPTLLIIEDNEEVRQFIKQDLEIEYNILEAENGKIGLDIAINQLPDLVISDVMMPEMDGIELCTHLKTNEKTNHIPVILLTARTSINQQIEGMESGADIYLSKPFHPRQLKVAVCKLIELRRILQSKYNQRINDSITKSDTFLVFQPTIETKQTGDERFLQQALQIVDKYKSYSDFGVEMFCKETGLTYLQLYRKIKALTNLTITEFILSIRLKTAEKLLLMKKYTIAEICYQVGFSSQAYFSKCFKEKYGVTPTEYIASRNVK